MHNDAIITKYMQYNKILLSVINIKNKTIDVFDGTSNNTYSYKEFCEFLSKKYDLIPSFYERMIIFFQTIDSNSETIEIDVEYKKTSGEPVNFVINVVKQNENEYDPKYDQLEVHEKQDLFN